MMNGNFKRGRTQTPRARHQSPRAPPLVINIFPIAKQAPYGIAAVASVIAGIYGVFALPAPSPLPAYRYCSCTRIRKKASSCGICTNLCATNCACRLLDPVRRHPAPESSAPLACSIEGIVSGGGKVIDPREVIDLIREVGSNIPGGICRTCVDDNNLVYMTLYRVQAPGEKKLLILDDHAQRQRRDRGISNSRSQVCFHHQKSISRGGCTTCAGIRLPGGRLCPGWR